MKTRKQLIDFEHKGNEKHSFKLRPTLLSLCMLTFIGGYSQTGQVNLNLKNANVKELFREIEKQTSYRFSYRDVEINNKGGINISGQGKELKDVLTNELAKQQLSYTVSGNKIIISPVKKTIVSTKENKVTGKVMDSNGEPVIGATIMEKGTTNGTITDFDGNFTLNVSDKSMLEVSYVGYQTQFVKAIYGKNLAVTLREDTELLDEVVVVGYGVQKKVNLTGAVVAIDNEKLQVTKNQNVQNMLTGKIPGVRVMQKTSEPGEFTNVFDIRGFGSPLVVIDGVPRDDMQRLDPNEIESISVLKDASAAIYGVRAANGVVLITTKKGSNTKAKVEYSMYYGIQTLTEQLETLDAVQLMTLENEKSMCNLTSPTWKYSQEEIDKYLSGEKIGTNWRDLVLRDTAPQQQHNLSVSGGSENVDYYINLGYMDQGGFFQSNSLEYNKYNLRSNINFNINKNLKASIKLMGIMDKKGSQYYRTWEVFKDLWRLKPIEPLYANNVPGKYYHTIVENSVASINKDINGFKERENKIFNSTFEIEYSIPYVKGLKLKGLLGYDYKNIVYNGYRKQYSFYRYDEANDTYTEYLRQSPARVERSFDASYNVLSQLSVSYDNTFNNSHHVSGLLLYEDSYKKTDNFNANRKLSLMMPYLYVGLTEDQIGTSNPISEIAKRAFVGRFNYDYQGKYLGEFAFRYDGSSLFPSNSRWGFFPSMSLGWRISEEAFIKENLSFVDNLKLRASYGKMGDDSVAAYQFVSGYTYPAATGNQTDSYPGGYVFGDSFVNGLSLAKLANPSITWYTVETLNLGVDMTLWNGLFGMSFDIYQRDRDGLMAYRSVGFPGSFGAVLPQENLNGDRVKGLEMELRHNNTIEDFSYNVSANFAVTRFMNRHVERTPSSNSMDNWRNNYNNRYTDMWFAYGDGGRYYSWDDIWSSEVYVGDTTLPGDLISEDWNEDGIIDENDKYPLVTTQDKKNYPLFNFGLNMGAQWKNFDITLNFQGSALSHVSYPEQLTEPLKWNCNALIHFYDRWHPVDPKANMWDPATEWIEGKYPAGARNAQFSNNTSWGIQNGAYLRLKSAEIGYTLPKKWLSFARIQSLRIFASGYNLFTITGVDGLDPERPTDTYGYIYPLNRSFNFGGTIVF